MQTPDLDGIKVVESPILPFYPTPTEQARRIVRHGMRDVLEWLGEEIGPEPGPTHAIFARVPGTYGGAPMLFASKQLIAQLRDRAHWTECVQCGHPTDPQDPQPCEEGGTCVGEDPELMALWAENDARLWERHDKDQLPF